MKFQQYEKTNGSEWKLISPQQLALKKPLVLVFGNRFMLEGKKYVP